MGVGGGGIRCWGNKVVRGPTDAGTTLDSREYIRRAVKWDLSVGRPTLQGSCGLG